MISSRVPWFAWPVLVATALLAWPARAYPAAEVKLDTDFLFGVIEKLPPAPFQKEGRYRGTVDGYRLVAIDARSRRFLVACQVAGEFRSPLALPTAEKAQVAPAGSPPAADWRTFRFDVRVGVNIEPGGDGTPRFRVDVEDVKRRELEGFAGALATVLGKSFDDLVIQVIEGKASKLNEKLNAEIMKRVKAFQEYGLFYAIEYDPSYVVLRFDVSRFVSDGIAGYVFVDPRAGTVPLYHWVHMRRPVHVYSINAFGPDRRLFKAEEIACYVFAHPEPGSVPLRRWRRGFDFFYTTASDNEHAFRRGYQPEGVACHLYPDPMPGTVPLFRFVEPRTGLHCYSTDSRAEFGK
ncbi:MAG: hypothetical protein P4L84_37785 [Isosphaeraceae bacterium]|nr:hypothetical protein [Isosphaeraceae bacterium]